MKFVIILTIIIIMTESYPRGTMCLSCPNGEPMINCDEVQCCPPDNTTCCIDQSALNNAIPLACASIYPRGHPLGC